MSTSFWSSIYINQNKEDEQQKAAILIQHWWRQNQWKKFYTIPDEDVISTECNPTNDFNSDNLSIESLTFGNDDNDNDHIVNRYENLVINHNNFIHEFFYSLFHFIYNGFKFMLGFK